MKMINLKELFRPKTELNLAIGEFTLEDCKNLIKSTNHLAHNIELITDDYEVMFYHDSYILNIKADINGEFNTLSFFIADWPITNKPQFTTTDGKYLVYEY